MEHLPIHLSHSCINIPYPWEHLQTQKDYCSPLPWKQPLFLVAVWGVGILIARSDQAFHQVNHFEPRVTWLKILRVTNVGPHEKGAGCAGTAWIICLDMNM